MGDKPIYLIYDIEIGQNKIISTNGRKNIPEILKNVII